MKHVTVAFFLLVGLLLIIPYGKTRAQIAVVVNKKNTIQNLTQTQLKNLYIGRVTFFTRDLPVSLGAYSPLKDSFYKKITGKSAKAFQKHWLNLVLSGENTSMPQLFKEVKAVEAFIRETRGAITFLRLKEVSSEMKIIRIDNKAPGDKGYLLFKE